MNVKINDKQKSDDRLLTKINSWRTAWRSLLTKFFADENLMLYSSNIFCGVLNLENLIIFKSVRTDAVTQYIYAWMGARVVIGTNLVWCN